MKRVQIGLEKFLQSPPKWIPGRRLGLLCNPASVDRHFSHARELINARFPRQLKALYSPQHGFFADKQDNMIESDDLIDPLLKIPVFSLYGQTRIPTKEMFAPIDVLIIDLQDVGTRVYTFIHTMAYCLEAARKFGCKVIVLDRPNPISGAYIEGNCLTEACASFVGRYPIPMRHGLTIGELALLYNHAYAIGSDLEVVSMQGWHRNMFYNDTGLPWVAPSPNLPTASAAMLYPGQVIWEGTNVSEGRGTTQPFEIFGAPFIDTDKMTAYLGGNHVPGAILRPILFEPTSNKWQDLACRGFQIHVIDPHLYKPFRTSIKLMQAVLHLYDRLFHWKQPPYEYEFERLPIDLIIGNKEIRQRIQAQEEIKAIEASWQAELTEFSAMSRKYHLYPMEA